MEEKVRTIEIPLDEYRFYIGLYEQVNIIKKFIDAKEFLSDRDLRLILGIETDTEESETE